MIKEVTQQSQLAPKGDDLNAWLSYIEALHPKSIEMGLERVKKVFSQLNIDLTVPIITVAGTNGKGSTCAMLERIYTEAGYRVACYTSPHFIHFNERIRVNLKTIDNTLIALAFKTVELARQDTQLTYFEFSTLAAFWIFSQQPIDVAVLEIGLGGRLDAVNILEPSCAIVTSIDLDHMDYLGATREKIGFEKAGIYRANKPAICGDANPPFTLHEYAIDIHADYLPINQAFQFQLYEESWDYSFDQIEYKKLPKPSLKGGFQIENAACVLTAISKMQTDLPVTENAIRAGLLNVFLLGRFQQIKQQPIVIVDVAHNPQAALSLAHNLRSTDFNGKTIAVLAMLADKDICGVIQAVGAQIDVWHIASISTARGANSNILEYAIQKNFPSKPIFSHLSIVAAYKAACLQASENNIHIDEAENNASVFLGEKAACKFTDENVRIVVFGSFYTVAAILQLESST